MLELLELQARARAIRSQLALEPVTKIELDSDDEEGNSKTIEPSTSKSVNDKSKEEKGSADVKKPEPVVKLPLKNILAQTIKRVDPPPPKQTQSAKPVKLKRNYKKQTIDDATISVTNSESNPIPFKSVEPPSVNDTKVNDDDDRCSSPDVITMDKSPETFFISDSEDEEPPPKKSPEKKEVQVNSPEEVETTLEAQLPEDGELSEKSTRENSTEADCRDTEKSSQPADPEFEPENDNTMNDDVVHLMSDTEIELHHQEDEETPKEIESKTSDKLDEPQKKSVDTHQAMHSDDDVVEINNSSDDDMMNESDKSAGGSAKTSQTWEDRWLSSSKTQNILKTTKFESKVRNSLRTKKSQKATEKKKEENEKAVKEKVSNLEEGSMEQFKTISSSN